MIEISKIAKDITEKLGMPFFYYIENSTPADAPFCDRQFEGVTDDGTYTFFRFLYKNVGYVGAIEGVGQTQKNYATFLPAYIEGFAEKESDLSKSEHLRRILLGESSSASIHRYCTKYSVKSAACFALAIYTEKMLAETLALIEQYSGNSLDAVVKMDEKSCVLVKFLSDEEKESVQASDYAEFLSQSIQEELGVVVTVGVGGRVKELKDVALSYAQAASALRYAEVFESKGNIHSYREFMLVKMLEEIPESKLAEFLYQLCDENASEIFEDEDMLGTAEEFLQSSLNVSETSRNLYMHRNTLLYRLDKIEKATGLNIRQFSDAVSFRVLTILYKLLGK